jgi:hypothetical protein
MRPKPTRFLAVVVLLASPIVSALADGQEPAQTREQDWRQQRKAKSKSLKPYHPGSLEAGTLYVQKERLLQRFAEGWSGFHPKLGGLSTGSGFAGGIRYAPRIAEGRVDFQTSGAISPRLYQFYDLKLAAPKLLGGRAYAEFYSRYRSYPQEDFFGLGPSSRRQDRTNFALEDALFDVSLGWNWTKWLRTGITAGHLKTNTGRGTDRRFPSTDSVVSPVVFPELAEQPSYNHLDALFRVDYRDEPLNPHSGGKYQLSRLQ